MRKTKLSHNKKLTIKTWHRSMSMLVQRRNDSDCDYKGVWTWQKKKKKKKNENITHGDDLCCMSVQHNKNKSIDRKTGQWQKNKERLIIDKRNKTIRRGFRNKNQTIQYVVRITYQINFIMTNYSDLYLKINNTYLVSIKQTFPNYVPSYISNVVIKTP